MLSDMPKKLKIFLEIANAMEPPATPAAMREAIDGITQNFSGRKPDVAVVIDRALPVDDRTIQTRIYDPNPQKMKPLIFYFHGGGHVAGNLKSHDNLCRRIALAAGCVVVGLEYRLAPEFPYPAGVVDCIEVVKQRVALLHEIQADTSRVLLAGDSAGGNLALSVANALLKEGATYLIGMALIYPSTDFAGEYDSYVRNGKGYLLTYSRMQWYFQHYFPDSDKKTAASPIRSESLKLMPPTYIAIAEFDPLYDEGVELANKLKELGIQVQLEEFKGMIHAFAQLETLATKQVTQLITSIGRFARDLSTR